MLVVCIFIGGDPQPMVLGLCSLHALAFWDGNPTNQCDGLFSILLWGLLLGGQRSRLELSHIEPPFPRPAPPPAAAKSPERSRPRSARSVWMKPSTRPSQSLGRLGGGRVRVRYTPRKEDWGGAEVRYDSTSVAVDRAIGSPGSGS